MTLEEKTNAPALVDGCGPREDLVLAKRCACGDSASVALLRARYERALRRVLEQRGFGDICDEVLQRVFEKVTLGERPDIAGYDGRGSLDGWLRTVALRMALNLRRSRRREQLSNGGALFERATMATNPEQLCIERSYEKGLSKAIEQAVRQLDTRARHVLRCLYLEGLNIDEVGVRHGVHRATVARWRARAHEQLLREIRRRFLREHDVSPSELQSVVRQIESKLDLSLPRLFSSDEPGRATRAREVGACKKRGAARRASDDPAGMWHTADADESSRGRVEPGDVQD